MATLSPRRKQQPKQSFAAARRSRERRLLVERLEDRSLLAGFNFASFGDASSLNLVGSAAVTAGNHLRLTPAVGGQSGAAWFAAEKQFVGGSFSTTFQFRMADNFDSPGGSDGFTFAIQNANPHYLQGGGGTLGYNNLPSSLVVEFDTFQNSEASDPSGSHISVHTNGTGPNSWLESLSLGSYNTSPIMDDGNIHTAKITYTPGTLSIYLDNLTTPKLTVAVDLADKLALADGRAWIGFTAATGGGWQTHDILNWNFDATIPATQLSIGDVAKAEGNSGTSNFVFTVTRSGNLSGTTTVNWATANGTAVSPSDYTAASGKLTFKAQETTKTVSVSVKGDTAMEPDETFLVKLSGASGGAIVDGTGLGTILNDEIAISIGDATATEGDSAFGNAGYFVAPDANGLATARTILLGPDGNVYVASHDTDSVKIYSQAGNYLGELTTPGGELDGPWGMTFGPDGKLYAGGRFSRNVVRFDIGTGAADVFVSAAASGGLGAVRSLTFGPDGNLYVSSRMEGAPATTDMVKRYDGATGAYLDDFVPAGSGGLSGANGVAFGPDGNLYVASTSSREVLRYDGHTGAFLDVFIPLGSGGLTNPQQFVFHTDGRLYVGDTISVRSYDAATGEFRGVAASGLSFTATGTAFTPSGEMLVSVGTAMNAAGSAVQRFAPGFVSVSVSLSTASSSPVTVNYATVNGTALAGADYAAASGTLTFAPGVTSQPVLVQVLDDALLESNETFRIVLSGASGATIADVDGTVTIVDDEAQRQISISDATATEGGTAAHYRGRFVDVLPNTNFNDLTFGPDGMLYAAPGPSGGVVNKYDGTTGAFLGNFTSGRQIAGPRDIVFRDGYMYVGSEGTNEVLRFDAATGAFVDAFVTAGSGGIQGPHGLIFGPDTNGDGVDELFVVGRQNFTVVRYDGATGQPLGSMNTSGSGALSWPEGITLGPNNTLYVASTGSNQVQKYNALTGAYLGAVTNAALLGPKGIRFGPDGLLYVTSSGNDRLLRFTGSGVFVDDFVPAGSGGMDDPYRLEFGPDGNLYVSALGTNGILRFGTESEIIFTVSIPAANTIPINVSFATADGTATAGSDYVATSGTVTFAPGVTSKTIRIPLLDDAAVEGNETFTVNLSNPVGGVIADGQGVGTIVDDDLPPTKFYVVDDAAANKTFEYGASGSAVENYNLSSANSTPRGAASTAAGDKVWVVDANKNVYVYDAAGGLLGSWTAGSLPSNANVQGITTNGTDVWIVDAQGDKVYRYTGAASRTSGSQTAASNFALNSSNKDATDLVTDGASIWVVNNTSSADKVFKYTVSGSLQGSWTIDGGGGSPTGITLDPAAPAHLWIVDSATDRVYQYDSAVGRNSGSQAASTSFALAAGNTNPQGIADPPVPAAASEAREPVADDSRSAVRVHAAATDQALLALLGDWDLFGIGGRKKRR